MDVLFVSEYFPPKIMGGGEINLFSIAAALSKKGIGVTVLTSFHAGLKKEEEMENIHVYRRLKTGTSPQGILNNLKRSAAFPRSVGKEVTKITKEQKIDLIHFIGTSIIAAERLKGLGIPLVATIESFPTVCPKGDRIYHGKEECKVVCSRSEFKKCQAHSDEIGKMKNKFYIKHNPLALRYIYTYYEKLNRSLHYCTLIAISNYVQQLLKQQGVESTVIPNALDVKIFASIQSTSTQNDVGNHDDSTKNSTDTENNTDRNKIDQNKKVRILYLGSLTKYKGPQILLKAIERMDMKDGMNVRCDLYGEGILREELQQMINENGLDAEIHPPVPYQEIPDLYAKADIVVFPSLWPEPFGRIAIEAMAAGKPVIGSRVGAIPELIAEETGILVAPGNSVELRQAIQKLITNPARREELGKNGRKVAENDYSADSVITKVLLFYENIAPDKKVAQ